MIMYLFLFWLTSGAAQAPASVRITEAQARAAVASAAAQAKTHGDLKKLCEKELQKIAPKFDADPVYLSNYTNEAFYLTGPAASMCMDAADAMRKMEPIDAALSWYDGIRIGVVPKTYNASDIEKVVVMRDGVAIQATQNDIAPMEFSNAMGAKFTIGAGYALFPFSAFDLGPKRIEVVLIPKNARRNITYRLVELQLLKLN